jgi:hypothetical protein
MMGDVRPLIQWDRIQAGAFNAAHLFLFLLAESIHVEVPHSFKPVFMDLGG